MSLFEGIRATEGFRKRRLYFLESGGSIEYVSNRFRSIKIEYWRGRIEAYSAYLRLPPPHPCF